MNENIFLYTLPQWFIFSALFVIVYGWVEKKKVFKLLGLSILIALALFATYVISKGYFAPRSFFTPNEMTDGQLTEGIPVEGQIMPAYLSFIISGLLAIPGMFFEIKNKKQARLFMVIAGLISLFGFFVIVGALKQM